MYFTNFIPILSPFNQQMETHASDEISKERQRRSQQGGGGGGDVDGLEGGMAGVSLREGEGGDAEANDAEAEGNNGEEKGDDGGDNEDDVDDDDDEDCDYVPENYHDENSKHPRSCTICICE